MGILYFTAILIKIPHLGCFGLFWRGEGNSVTRDYTPRTSTHAKLVTRHLDDDCSERARTV